MIGNPAGQFGVEMLSLGKADAIFVELRNHLGQPLTLLIDGGGQDAHLSTRAFHGAYHQNNPLVAISTHPDTDHIGGLATFVENVKPNALVVNNPLDFVQRPTLMQRSRQQLGQNNHSAFQGAIERIEELHNAASGAGTRVYRGYASQNPFLRWGYWNIYIVGPSYNAYSALWQDLSTVYDDGDDETHVQELLRQSKNVIDDGTDTTGMNNSSIMVLIEGHGEKMLFTGDAGMQAIYDAAQVRNLSNLTFLDVPHHGSRRNVNSAIIDYLRPTLSFVSADGSDKHPRLAVIRKLQAVGSTVCSTHHNNESLYYYRNIPRPNYAPAHVWPLLLPSGRG